MAACIPVGMLSGEWDANLMGIMEADFMKLHEIKRSIKIVF